MKAVLLALSLLLTALPARAQSAADTVNNLHTALLETMKAGPELGFDGRARNLAPTLALVYDFPHMTRRALGADAARLPAEQLERISDALRRYTVAVYANQFRSWDGERFETGKTVGAHAGGVLVPTRILPVNGDGARLTYLLHETGEGWRIVDVLLDGTISQLAVRRSEFQTVLRREGPEGLETLLERRTAALAADAARP